VAKKNRWDNYTSSARAGLYIGDRHDGVMEVANCDFREFANNAMYSSRTSGDVRVWGTYFENNNAAHCRIGGDGSWIKNCEFVNDPALYDGPEQGGDQQLTMIVIEENFAVLGFEKDAGAYVEDSTFRYENVGGDGGSAIEVYQNGRSFRVTNCEIEYNNDGTQEAIERLEYDTRGGNNNPPGSEPRDLELDNVTIKGSADIPAAVEITDGDNSVIKNSCIEWTDHSPDGVVCTDTRSDGETMSVTIEDTNINVPGQTVVENGCTVTQTNVTTGQTCTLDGVQSSPASSAANRRIAIGGRLRASGGRL
jgi:hypothetical protein